MLVLESSVHVSFASVALL